MAINALSHPQSLMPARMLSTTLVSTPIIEDQPNIQLPFGIDLSKHNTSADGKQKVDFDYIAAKNPPYVSFIAMRAGISWGYQDPWFNYYFTETQRIKRFPMPYHVLYPGQPASRQMDNFFRIIGDINFKTTPLVLDLELDHGQTVATITRTTINALAIILQRTGRIPVIYSRAQWVNTYLSLADLPPVIWWLAQYRYSLPYPLYTPEYPCPPTLPKGVSTWHFHQTTQRGCSIGAPGLYYMDHNRFNGTLADLHTFFGSNAPGQVLATCPLDQQPCVRGLPQPEAPAASARRSEGRDGAAGKTVSGPQFRVQLSLKQSQTASGVCTPHERRALPAGAAGSTGKPPDGATAPAPMLPNWIGHKQHFSRINPKE